MASITITPTNIYQYYEWNSSWQINQYGQYDFKNSLLQMPSLSSYGITSSMIKKITIHFGEAWSSAEDTITVSDSVGIGFTTSVAKPSSYAAYTTISYKSSFSAAMDITFTVVPTVSVSGTWYIGTTQSSTTYPLGGENITVTIEYSTSNTVKYYTGSAWVDCIVYYHNGSGWVECVPYYHNGSGWVECSTS